MFDIEIVLLEGLLKSASNLRTPIFPVVPTKLSWLVVLAELERGGDR